MAQSSALLYTDALSDYMYFIYLVAIFFSVSTACRDLYV